MMQAYRHEMLSRTWVFLWRGFRQSDRRSSGMERLWHRLDKFRQPGLSIQLQDWDDSTDAKAEQVYRIWQYDISDDSESVEPPTIINVGYSYGGTTANNFNRQLMRRGLEVYAFVACDAVYRPYRQFPSALSLYKNHKIKVPPNVGSVYTFHQRTHGSVLGFWKYPSGHDVVADNDEATNVYTPVEINAGHNYIDDNPKFQQCVERIVREFA